jgi:hypothetical protein
LIGFLLFGFCLSFRLTLLAFLDADLLAFLDADLLAFLDADLLADLLAFFHENIQRAHDFRFDALGQFFNDFDHSGSESSFLKKRSCDRVSSLMGAR